MRHTTDSMRQYLDQIGRVPLLDADGERRLARRVEAGHAAQARIDAGEDTAALRRAVRDGARAKDEFIQANLRLVVSLAKRYPVPPGMELLDLVQEGNLGLEHAVDKFDWKRGFKFSTYATFWIRQAIGRALDQKGSIIRIPGDRSSQLRAALRAANENGEELEGDLDELRRLTTVASLDRPVGDESDVGLGDLLGDATPSPETSVLDRLEEDAVVGLLAALDERPRRALELRMGLLDGEGRSFRQVGEELGITAEAARRMVQRALVSLRDEAAAFELAA